MTGQDSEATMQTLTHPRKENHALRSTSDLPSCTYVVAIPKLLVCQVMSIAAQFHRLTQGENLNRGIERLVSPVFILQSQLARVEPGDTYELW